MKRFFLFFVLLFHHLSDEIVVKPNFLFRKDQSLFVIPDFYKLIFSQLSVRFTHFAFIRFSMNAQPTVFVRLQKHSNIYLNAFEA